ncbi:mitochondrial-processing peptidase subunit beta [Acrasis kona]|uniref:Mitochondrial-processing peptidase subunit beta n=1 Tax=Acrasis kona TaxID=1008807 RepID=A0AAW2YVK5_9EUKA
MSKQLSGLYTHARRVLCTQATQLRPYSMRIEKYHGDVGEEGDESLHIDLRRSLKSGKRLKDIMKTIDISAIAQNKIKPPVSNKEALVDFTTQIPNITFQEENQSINYFEEKVSVDRLEDSVNVCCVQNSSSSSSIMLTFPRGSRHVEIGESSGTTVVLTRLIMESLKKYPESFFEENQHRLLVEYVCEEESTYVKIFLNNKEDFALGMDVLSQFAQVEFEFNDESIQEAIEFSHNILELEKMNPTEGQFHKELVHTACYGKDLINGSLGNPTYSREDITKQDLLRTASKLLQYKGASLLAVNIDKEHLLEVTKKTFPPQPPKDFTFDIDHSYPSKWVAGVIEYEFQGVPHEIGRQNLPSLSNLSVSFKGVCWRDFYSRGPKHLFTAYVIGTLIGGGTSFSSGGPGKGMHSIINQYFLGRYALHGFQCQQVHYMDTGTFTLHASITNEFNTLYAVQAICDLLSGVKKYCNVESVERAKRQLKSQVFKSYEEVELFTINTGLNLAIFKDYYGTDFYVDVINSITVSDVLSVLNSIITGSEPSIVMIGDVAGMKKVDVLANIKASIQRFKNK